MSASLPLAIKVRSSWFVSALFAPDALRSPTTDHISAREMDAYLKVSVQNLVGEIVLNRPKKFNIMDDKFFAAFHEAARKIAADPNVRVIIVHAEGPMFTAGLDLKSSAAILNPADGPTDPAEKNAALYKRIKELQDSLSILRNTLKPTIAVVHGKCIGAGVDMITAADIRICSKDATFSIAETKVAIVADLGTLQRITGITGKGVAREMAFTGEPIDAQRALQCGLVHETREQALAAARAMATKIAANSPIVVSGTKKMLNYSDEHSHDDGLEHVALWNSLALMSNDLTEAIVSFLEKRPPQYKAKL